MLTTHPLVLPGPLHVDWATSRVQDEDLRRCTARWRPFHISGGSGLHRGFHGPSLWRLQHRRDCVGNITFSTAVPGQGLRTTSGKGRADGKFQAWQATRFIPSQERPKTNFPVRPDYDPVGVRPRLHVTATSCLSLLSALFRRVHNEADDHVPQVVFAGVCSDVSTASSATRARLSASVPRRVMTLLAGGR